MKFEVRIAAFNRPAMLRRALQSLQAQSYPHWNAIVYDDSTGSDSGEVVAALGDERIVHRRNAKRLGAVRNVDQCVFPGALFGGHYGCLLEDDNFWFPDFLSAVVDQLQRRTWRIVQTNQRLSDEDSGLRPIHETTRGGWFPVGRVEPLDLRAALLLMEGVSNSGLVWKLDEEIDLRVGDTVLEAGLNEFCRSLLVGTPFLFIEEPHGAYTVIAQSQSARAGDRNRAISRGVQSVRDYVLRMHGNSIVPIAERLAARRCLVDRLVESLAYSGYLRLAWSQAAGRERLISRSLAKGFAVRLLERDPCAAFFKSGRIAVMADAPAG